VSWSHGKDLLDASLAAAGAKLEPRTLHDLRRSAATGMAELGVMPHVVEAILNHFRPQGRRGGRLQPCDLREGKARRARHVGRACHGGSRRQARNRRADTGLTAAIACFNRRPGHKGRSKEAVREREKAVGVALPRPWRWRQQAIGLFSITGSRRKAAPVGVGRKLWSEVSFSPGSILTYFALGIGGIGEERPARADHSTCARHACFCPNPNTTSDQRVSIETRNMFNTQRGEKPFTPNKSAPRRSEAEDDHGRDEPASETLGRHSAPRCRAALKSDAMALLDVAPQP
jgi:hypothetical protein